MAIRGASCYSSGMSIMQLWGSVRGTLRETGLQEQSLRAAGTVLWRGVLLGAFLALSIGAEPSENLRFNIASYLVALIWSYYDGVFSKRAWSLAWIEAIFLHLAAVQFAKLLILAL